MGRLRFRARDGEEDMSEQTSAVAEAERIVADLEQKRRALIERGQELDESRRRLSFDALTGDAKSKAALDKANTEAARHGLDMENLVSAIAQSEANVAAARAAEAIAADKADAREVAKVLDQLAEHAGVVDDCLADLVTAGESLRASLNALHELGVHHPTHEMLATFGHLAILTGLNRSIWRRGFETLAPGQRKTFGDVVAAWRVSLMADVKRRLGEGEHTEVAA
jgi:hypothetical protein